MSDLFEVSRLEDLVRETVNDSTVKIHVGSDPFGGIRVGLVGEVDRFDLSTRIREALFDYDPTASIRGIHFVSTDEIAEGQSLSEFFAADVLDLPLWPERLAVGDADELEVRFASQQGDSLDPPVVATFYSLRGGVGRSTALAHAARILARQHVVICVDMDLEAPGLASLFETEDSVSPGRGVVDLLLRAEIEGNSPDVDDSLLRVVGSDSLFLLPAGTPNADYARKLSMLDPSAWYHEDVNPLRLLIDGIRRSSVSPDVILVDSRTGISPISAPLLFETADVSIVTFFPHPQARVGTRALTRALLGSRTERILDGSPLTPEPRFLASPVPISEDSRKFYEDRAIDWVQEWLSPARTNNGEKPFESVEELLHVVPYSEQVASSDSVADGSSLYEPVAAWIAGFVGSRDEPILESAGVEIGKDELLGSLSFTAATAEDQSDSDFEQTFLQTDVIGKALQPSVPLVIGRKGTGKTALFRHLSNREDAIVVTSPARMPGHRQWMPDQDVYPSLDALMTEQGLEWRSVWPCLVGIATVLSEGESGRKVTTPLELSCESLASREYGPSDLLADCRKLLSQDDAPIRVWDWLRGIDRSLSGARVLLLDGLDTGFGIQERDLVRRRQAISGLLEFYMGRESGLENLAFKILLREDIWRDVRVANKSHLFGRLVRLAWADQADYLRVAIKQAVRSNEFMNAFESVYRSQTSFASYNARANDVAYWPEALVYDAWIWLAGERVSGGKTAFTYNWVWSRLSDANDDHSPRTLIQLLNEAVMRERRISTASSYDRSLIRPRSLVESLDTVSEQAIEALSEEFKELEPLMSALAVIPRTPFDASELSVDPGLEVLAREVGLLGIDIGSEESVERYRVPELYRKALNMGRRGQA